MLMVKKHSDKELQKLGQMMVDMQELGYVGKSRTLGFAFVKGIATGFGVFLGGTVVIGLILWFLGFFDNDVANTIEDALKGANDSIKN